MEESGHSDIGGSDFGGLGAVEGPDPSAEDLDTSSFDSNMSTVMGKAYQGGLRDPKAGESGKTGFRNPSDAGLDMAGRDQRTRMGMAVMRKAEDPLDVVKALVSVPITAVSPLTALSGWIKTSVKNWNSADKALKEAGFEDPKERNQIQIDVRNAWRAAGDANVDQRDQGRSDDTITTALPNEETEDAKENGEWIPKNPYFGMTALNSPNLNFPGGRFITLERRKSVLGY